MVVFLAFAGVVFGLVLASLVHALAGAIGIVVGTLAIFIAMIVLTLLAASWVSGPEHTAHIG